MTPRVHCRLLSADLDGTLLGDTASADRFRQAWSRPSRRPAPLLCFNSGRLAADMMALVADGLLPDPDYLIGGVGTEIHGPDGLVDEYGLHLTHGWDRDAVERCVGRCVRGAVLQPPAYQSAVKVSWHWPAATSSDVSRVRTALEAAGCEARVIYSSRRDLDVVPARAGKGLALAWLVLRLGVPLGAVVVAGDSGNDADMFQLPDVHGILVANCHSDLAAVVAPDRTYRAAANATDGLIEGLRALGVLERNAEPERIHAEIHHA